MFRSFQILSLAFCVCGIAIQNGNADDKTYKKMLYQASFLESGLIIFPTNGAAVAFDSQAWVGTNNAQGQVEQAAVVAGFDGIQAPAIAQQSLSAIIGGPLLLPAKGIVGDGKQVHVISMAVEHEITKWETDGLSIDIPMMDLASDNGQKLATFTNVSFNATTIEGISRARMREVARQAAEDLFTEAALFACKSSILPETISPSVAVSFNFFAGAEFTIQATFKTDKLCEDRVPESKK